MMGYRTRFPEAGKAKSSAGDAVSAYGHHAEVEPTTFGARRKSRRVRAMLDSFVGKLPPSATFLEVGPGRGELADYIGEGGAGYLAIEPSTDLHRHLVARGIHSIQSAVPPIPVDDASVDVVYSVDVFEHLPSHKEAMEVCLEAHRALRPGGRLVIIAPNAETLGRLFYQYEYQHSFVTNKGRLEAMVLDAGFEVERSGAFLTLLGLSTLWPLDRLVAHLCIPVGRSSLFIGLSGSWVWIACCSGSTRCCATT